MAKQKETIFNCPEDKKPWFLRKLQEEERAEGRAIDMNVVDARLREIKLKFQVDAWPTTDCDRHLREMKKARAEGRADIISAYFDPEW